MARNNQREQQIRVWQWNCRGFGKKKGHLHLHIQNVEAKPDIIALQENRGLVSLANYKTHHQLDVVEKRDLLTATLVHRNITAIQHEIEGSKADYTLVEVIPSKKGERNLFILNLYSSPRDRSSVVPDLLRRVVKLAGRAQLVVAGDFNARHPAWGYLKGNPKGAKLWEIIQDLGLTILNDAQQPTRIGNSVSKDTSPDLMLTRNVQGAEWLNTGVPLGSDHYVVSITFDTAQHKRRTPPVRITDWDKFRTTREKRADGGITNLDAWISDLKRDAERATGEVDTTEEHPAVDKRLMHMWEAHTSLLGRWKTGKNNRKLRLRISRLEREIEDHANELNRQQWWQICDGINGQLGNKKSWFLLRHLLDPTTTKSAARTRLNQIVHQYDGTGEELLEDLKGRYINTTQDGNRAPGYTGMENETLDADIKGTEVMAAMERLRTTSAAGPDGINNKILRNLDDNSVQALTDYMNKCWKGGNIPPAWKHAKVTFIPKPGKKLDIENLRPISLTSCLGKLMEHVILTRLQNHVETHRLMPYTMIGFRPHLSTQDVMLQLSKEIVDPGNGHGTRAILGLDLKKAFDNVSHEAILCNLSELNVGRHTYDYIRDFLSNRTAQLTIGDLKSAHIPLGNRSTPQGSVLSPFLFNTALITLPRKLNGIEGTRHTLYADDVTIWTSQGSDGQIETALQEAADIVDAHARWAGLECSPQKSELLVIRNNGRACKTKPNRIQLKIQGNEIPEVDTMRVLGMYIQSNRCNKVTLDRLTTSVQQTIRLIKRVATRRQGMKERDACRLVQAFVISRIVYATPYLDLKKAESEKLNCLIRQAYKAALGLPRNASTVRLLSLGVHNTLEELIEAHLTSQEQRLRQTETGLCILRSLGMRSGDPSSQMTLPVEMREIIRVKPLPKNMQAGRHEGRRRARAKTLSKKYQGDDSAVYVDAAEYNLTTGQHAFAVSAVSISRRVAATVITGRVEEAEEAAIALGIVQKSTNTILSDSKTALRNFSRGRISTTAYKILSTMPNDRKEVDLVWVPAHVGVPGNESAHQYARGFVSRAGDGDLDVGAPRGEALDTYQAITNYYRELRVSLPPPHVSLSREQATTWRRLQTRSQPNPWTYANIFPDLVNPYCQLCGEPATLDHIIWDCAKDPPPADLVSSPSLEQWEAVLASPDLDVQSRALARAQEVADRLQLPTMWSS